MSVSERHTRNRRIWSHVPAARAWRRPGILLSAFAGLLLLIGIGFVALSPVSLLNAFSVWDRSRATLGIPYGPGPRGTLDVYAPEAVRPAAPVVVFFYGGNWQSGEKETYRFVGAALAARGLVAIIPDYRIYPEVRFPAFLDDGARAVRWAHDHAAQFGGDPGRMVLMGHSAGAYIAAMLSFDRQWLAAVGLDANRDVKGLVGLAGPYDFLPLRNPTFRIIFGPEDHLPATQPINFVDGTGPPAFLASGRNDGFVDPGNVTRLSRRIGEKGGVATAKFYDGLSHRTLIGAFAAPLRRLAPVLSDTVRFIDHVTGEPLATAAPLVGAAPR